MSFIETGVNEMTKREQTIDEILDAVYKISNDLGDLIYDKSAHDKKSVAEIKAEFAKLAKLAGRA
jgi:archaellum component FlaC